MEKLFQVSKSLKSQLRKHKLWFNMKLRSGFYKLGQTVASGVQRGETGEEVFPGTSTISFLHLHHSRHSGLHDPLSSSALERAYPHPWSVLIHKPMSLRNVCRHCQMPLGEQDCPHLRTTHPDATHTGMDGIFQHNRHRKPYRRPWEDSAWAWESMQSGREVARSRMQCESRPLQGLV